MKLGDDMSMSINQPDYATKDDIVALSHQLDACLNDTVTKKDLKITMLEFAKEYKLEWINTKINFILWIIAAAYPACFGYVMYKLDIINTILFQIMEKLPK
jgi:hypothetical protein